MHKTLEMISEVAAVKPYHPPYLAAYVISAIMDELEMGIYDRALFPYRDNAKMLRHDLLRFVHNLEYQESGESSQYNFEQIGKYPVYTNSIVEVPFRFWIPPDTTERMQSYVRQQIESLDSIIAQYLDLTHEVERDVKVSVKSGSDSQYDIHFCGPFTFNIKVDRFTAYKTPPNKDVDAWVLWKKPFSVQKTVIPYGLREIQKLKRKERSEYQ